MFCRTNASRKSSGGKQHTEGTNEVGEDCYTFTVKNGTTSSGVVTWCVVSVMLTDVFIDSGATSNIVNRTTVQPLLSGHTRDFENWPLNRGWPPNRGTI